MKRESDGDSNVADNPAMKRVKSGECEVRLLIPSKVCQWLIVDGRRAKMFLRGLGFLARDLERCSTIFLVFFLSSRLLVLIRHKIRRLGLSSAREETTSPVCAKT